MNKGILFDERIKCEKVKLISRVDKVLLGVYPTAEALSIAHAEGKNLIQLSEAVEGGEKYAICVLNEVKKHLYEQSKLKKTKTSKSQNTKEFCIKTNIDLSDLVRKLESVVEYVAQGEIVMLTVRSHRRGNQNIEEFVSHYLSNQQKLDHRISRRTARDAKFYISKRK